MNDVQIRRKYLQILTVAILVCIAGAAQAVDSGCWFGRENSPVSVPDDFHFNSVVVDRYFKIYYIAGDPFFQDADRNDLPDILERQIPTLLRSRHFMQTVLGWPLPATRTETGIQQLDVYFLGGSKKFTGAVFQDQKLQVVLNKNLLVRADFPSFWIHQFAHAAELMYRPAGEYWFYEATAGWMEGQFQTYSFLTNQAQRNRFEHPEISLTDDDPAFALGSSKFIELLARPVKDVIRQTWEQWSYTRDGKVMEVLENVLSLNHLPSLDSYLQNYFLMFPPSAYADRGDDDFQIQPFAAALVRGEGSADSGGIKLEFIPTTTGAYSTSTIFFTKGEKSGTLAMKLGLTGNSSIVIPFAGMDQFRYVIVNGSSNELRGILHEEYDSAIPGTLEYFKVNPEEKGVSIEWKTTRENGVAFWNLYRVHDGQKQRLNDFPIPASIESSEGVHYIFFDSESSVFYSLEAITSDGFASPLGSSDSSQ
ncbi:hypothetical protein L0244_01180 [bacterium]|nr:hypothetical protein [bacterium]